MTLAKQKQIIRSFVTLYNTDQIGLTEFADKVMVFSMKQIEKQNPIIEGIINNQTIENVKKEK